MNELSRKPYELDNYNGKYVVSASSIDTFFKDTREFFNIIEGNPTFKGNDSTVLGTFVHYIASQTIMNKPINKEEMFNYMVENSEYITDENLLDKAFEISEILIPYIKSSIYNYKYCEDRFSYKISDNFMLCGTADLVVGDELIDFKTTKDQKKIYTFPEHYISQLSTYLYLLKNNNIEINRFSLIWITIPNTNRISEKTGKRLKEYPTQINKISMEVNNQILENIEKKINLIRDSIELSISNPEYKHIIFKDYDLKEIIF